MIQLTDAEHAELVESREQLLRACKAVLLFHNGAAWTGEEQDEWRKLTGFSDATTKVYCDTVRAAVVRADRAEAPPK